jgi:signal transduction histidine kinase
MNQPAWNSMSLRIKFIFLIGIVVVISYGITFYRTSQFQNELVLSQAARQARMLHKQILMTRQWVADHNGLFFLRQPGVEANPFLDQPEMVDSQGRRYVKRNPAMVTRELSAYADKAGFCGYRVTTLKTINPENAPDPWERQSLLLFEQGVPEVIEFTKSNDHRTLRYIAPLPVEQSCLECHDQQGYEVGDIRGGLSVTIPVDWAYESIASNNRLLLFIATITIVIVGLAIYLLIDLLVVRRLGMLETAMENYPESKPAASQLPGGGDEIGRLAGKFNDFCQRLDTSQQQLDASRKQLFQNEKLAALGRLAAGVAHEVNNPLGGMLNCVKSMVENPDDKALHSRYLALMDKGLKRIGTIVQQLLNFGRREPLQYRAASFDELIRESFVLLEYGLKKLDVRLELGLPALYPIDSAALQQIIVNITMNAMQAMAGGGTLLVSTQREGDMALLTFTDSGPGISAENLPRIFDPFFTTKDVGEGTGLGLAVTYALVQRMQGVIEVESSPGQGSTFRVRLPLHPDIHEATP